MTACAFEPPYPKLFMDARFFADLGQFATEVGTCKDNQCAINETWKETKRVISNIYSTALGRIIYPRYNDQLRS